MATGPFRAVTFDSGRTLLHWWMEERLCFGELCRRAGIAVSPSAAQHGAGACARFFTESPPPPAATATQAWWLRYHAAGLRAAGVTDDVDVLAARLEHLAASVDAEWVLDRDVPEVLDQLLAKGLTLAVVSNADGTLAERFRSLGIADRFAYIADSAVVGARKPDPEIYWVTCRNIGIPPSACLHVGDRVDADAGVALAAGATPVIYDPLDVLPGDHCRVRRLLDVLLLV
jgi:putative hydrolase of the HAD superfamily